MATLQVRLSDLITAIGTDWKNIWSNTGDKTDLDTTDTSNLVNAINEVKVTADAAAGGLVIDDVTSSTTTTYSSDKINALDAVKADDDEVVKLTGAQTVAGVKTFSSAPVVPDGSFTIGKTTGLQGAIDAKAEINDASAENATTTTYSANKIHGEIAESVAALVGTAGTTLDTLGELSDALGDDANFATTITTALGKRLRVDAAQSFTLGEKSQGRANLDAYGSVEIGNPDIDLVALYTTAKA